MTDDSPRWIVLKFGGTSVSSAASWATIADVVSHRVDEGYRPLVVLSAVAGVTAGLEALASAGLDGGQAPLISEIDARHDTLASELGLSSQETSELLRSDRNELHELVEGVAAVGEPRTRARLLAYGERMATRIGAAFLQRQGIPVTWLDARASASDALLPLQSVYGLPRGRHPNPGP